jgi:hypothetical protein
VKYKFAQRLQMTGGRLHVQHPELCLEMEDTMPQSKDDTAADLHIYAAHAHTAAAAAHHRGDHEAAEELSSRAQDYSMAASEKTIEIAKQTQVPMRA